MHEHFKCLINFNIITTHDAKKYESSASPKFVEVRSKVSKLRNPLTPIWRIHFDYID